MNGIGYGLMLFLIAAGLTLVFGMMDMLNLAHGSLYMSGGYVAATIYNRTGSFVLAIVVAICVSGLLALVIEVILIRRLYVKDHLAQVLATFGVILIANDVVKAIWGAAPIMMGTPEALSGPVEILPGFIYPSYRLLIILAGLFIAAAIFYLVSRTRLGMLVRAGAFDRQMTELMGVEVPRVFVLVFVIGAVLAGFAGALLGPISSIEVGMGETILIPALIVVVIGGIGSVRGAFIASMMIGLVDTIGRAFVPGVLGAVLPSAIAADIGSGLTNVSMYLLMAAILACKPTGLFPARA